jgi:hypothetical protein
MDSRARVRAVLREAAHAAAGSRDRGMGRAGSPAGPLQPPERALPGESARPSGANRCRPCRRVAEYRPVMLRKREPARTERATQVNSSHCSFKLPRPVAPR